MRSVRTASIGPHVVSDFTILPNNITHRGFTMPVNQGAIAPVKKGAAIAQQTRNRAADAVQSSAGFGTTFMAEVLEDGQAIAQKRLTGQKAAMANKIADQLVAAVESEAGVVGDFFGVSLSGIVGEALQDWQTGAIDVPTN
jgi:hypothetical protein